MRNNLNLVISIIFALLAILLVFMNNLELALFNALMCTLYARWHVVDQREVNIVVKGSDINVTIDKSRREG